MWESITIADADEVLAASFIPALGMVGNSLRHDGEELFAQLRGPDAYASEHKTFALPLLHPWANRLSAWDYEVAGRRVRLERDDPALSADAHGIPIHGIHADESAWQVTSTEPDALVAELDFDEARPAFPAFPFRHRARYEARVVAGDGRCTLTVTFTVLATGPDEVPVSFGFHPYLTLPGGDRSEWTVELPVAARALLDAQQIPTGETVALAPYELDGPLGDRTFDDSFPELVTPGNGGAIVFSAADFRRRLTVELNFGYPVAQVYAPADADFMCFEPMTAPVDALRRHERLPLVPPGERFTAEFTIGVERIG